MLPKSFSATAMQTAEACPARYKAENIDYARGINNSAAGLGSAVHNALEIYVIRVYIDKVEPASLKSLLDFFKMTYMQVFNTAELKGEDYDDGVAMLKAWHKRNNIEAEGRTVISAEVKTSFPIKTSQGEIPFNYIWDRFDQTGENEYTVVDYKTNRWGYNPDDLKKLIQARAYGVAAQILHPNATRIWVEFDMLRHKGPVGLSFSRDDNIATWNFMKATAEKILAADPDDLEEKLNPTCNFCVRKQSCKALKANIGAGGVFSIASPAAAVDHRTQLAHQMKALKSAMDELDVVILEQARNADEHIFESDTNRMTIGVSSTRAVEPDMAERVLGPEIFRKYAGKSFTIGVVDRLMKGDEITEEQKKQLRSLIYMKQGEPRVKVERKSPLE